MSEEEQRLVIVRKSVHDKLMELKKFFEKDLGEEVSFNAFLMMVLDKFEAIAQVEDAAPKGRIGRSNPFLPFDPDRVIGIPGEHRDIQPIWVVPPDKKYLWTVNESTNTTDTTTGTWNWNLTAGTTCSTCGHGTVTSGSCSYCGTQE